MSHEKISEIIDTGEFSYYILGDESSILIYPEEQYRRWLRIEKYYKSKTIEDRQKNIVEDSILELLNHGDDKGKYVAIVLGRLLRLPSVVNKIEELILSEKFNKLNQNLQNELCFSATFLQIKNVGAIVAKYFLNQNKLKDFIFSSKTPSYIEEVKEDDLWRLEMIHNLYNSSPEKLQVLIENEIRDSARISRNFYLSIRLYLSKMEARDLFMAFLEKIK